MNNIMNTISEIYSEADRKAVEAIVGQSAAINSMLDDAYGSMLSGCCVSAMICATEAVSGYQELIELAETETSTVIRAALLDAFGMIKLGKFELPVGIEFDLKERAKNALKIK